MICQDDLSEVFDLLQDEDIMQWGKYKGKPMKEIPDRYLGWFWSEARFYSFGVRRGYAGQLSEYIERRMEKRKKQLKPEKYPKYLRLEPYKPIASVYRTSAF